MLKAVIFDFNGVLIDDERLHCRAFQRVLAGEGIGSFSEREYFGRYLGLDDRGCFAAVLTDAGRPTRIDDVAHLVERKAGYYLEELERGLRLFPGAATLVKRMARNFALAICSGARQHEIELVLDRSRLRSYFRVIVSADQIHVGKPDPGGYLATLACLREAMRPSSLDAGECLVFEDAPAGVQAAHAAGMRSIAVTNSCAAEELAAAERVVRSLEEVDDRLLAEIFR